MVAGETVRVESYVKLSTPEAASLLTVLAHTMNFSLDYPVVLPVGPDTVLGRTMEPHGGTCKV